MRNLKDRLLIDTNYQETRPSEITHPLVDPASTHAIPMQISFFFFLSKSRISQLVKMYENEKSMILSTLMLPSKNTRVAEASMFIVVYWNVFFKFDKFTIFATLCRAPLQNYVIRLTGDHHEFTLILFYIRGFY